MDLRNPLRTGFLTVGWGTLALSFTGFCPVLGTWFLLLFCAAGGACVAGRTGSRRLSKVFFVLFGELALVVAALALTSPEWTSASIAATAGAPLLAALNLELWYVMGSRGAGPSRCRLPFRLAALAVAWWIAALLPESPLFPEPAPVARMDRAEELFAYLK